MFIRAILLNLQKVLLCMATYLQKATLYSISLESLYLPKLHRFTILIFEDCDYLDNSFRTNESFNLLPITIKSAQKGKQNQ